MRHFCEARDESRQAKRGLGTLGAHASATVEPWGGPVTSSYAASELFPLSSKYDQDWAEANSFGENVLQFVESLAEVVPFTAGARVLDLGCGNAISSIFLAREFGVQVWAVDLAINPTANYWRAEEMKCADLVHPMRADVRSLPLPHGYFDAVVAFDSYRYFGTDDRFLPRLAGHIRTGGYLGIVDACSIREITDLAHIPTPLQREWRYGGWYNVHTIDWWRWHWAKVGLVDIVLAEPTPGSDVIRTRYLDRFRDDVDEVDMVTLMEAEGGTLTGSFRMVAIRNDATPPLEDDGDTPY